MTDEYCCIGLPAESAPAKDHKPSFYETEEFAMGKARYDYADLIAAGQNVASPNLILVLAEGVVHGFDNDPTTSEMIKMVKAATSFVADDLAITKGYEAAATFLAEIVADCL